MKIKKFTYADIILAVLMVLWGLLIFYPFYNSILVSFMTQAEFMRKPFSIFVQKPTLIAYEEIFSDDKIFNGYKSVL
ncbi:MAG: carbohydrate ABC transporter permease, partial [Clostridia bacterium]|nr:carbohydrate ABC transporter permease [Clostridia bacterium]